MIDLKLLIARAEYLIQIMKQDEMDFEAAALNEIREALEAISRREEYFYTNRNKIIGRERIIGEMAGALLVCAIVLKQEDINKKGLEDILERYRKEFGE